jgi:PAS domain-containing protein
MATQAAPRYADETDQGMRARIGAFDWGATPLGNRAGWPDSLRTVAQLVMDAAAPMALYWGPDLHLIYNDAWSEFLQARHPDALGRPAREVWPELWQFIEPQFRQVLETGAPLSLRRQLLVMTRSGQEEDTYFNYDFSPIRDDDGRVVGILNTADEVTDGVEAERRLSFQVALADRLRGCSSDIEGESGGHPDARRVSGRSPRRLRRRR